MKSLIASGSFIEKSEDEQHTHTETHTHTFITETQSGGVQEPGGLNSHCTGGANRRPGMEVQMGVLS